tara:strand:+ start:1661 stop:1855 length:195 start_codon:yes stop_codon:yes gene_type:complete
LYLFPDISDPNTALLIVAPVSYSILKRILYLSDGIVSYNELFSVKPLIFPELKFFITDQSNNDE